MRKLWKSLKFDHVSGKVKKATSDKIVSLLHFPVFLTKETQTMARPQVAWDTVAHVPALITVENQDINTNVGDVTFSEQYPIL